MFMLKSAALFHAAHRSSNNGHYPSDARAIFFEPDTAQELHVSGCLYLLADSVAGAAGERAGQYAARKVHYEYYKNALLPPAERLRHAIRQASGELASYSAQQFAPMYAAASLTAAVVRRGLLTIAQAGSGYVWLVRGNEARSIAPTRLSPEAETRRPDVLGNDPDVDVDLFADIPLMEGDRIVLCTEGLARLAIPADWLRLTESGAPEEIVRQCVDFAVRGGVEETGVVAVVVGPPLSASQPLKLVAHGQPPHPVTPQDMVGPQVEPENPTSTGLKIGPIPRKALPWAIGGGLAFAALWIGIVIVGLGWLSPSEKQAPPTQTMTQAARLPRETESPLAAAASCPATCLPEPTLPSTTLSSFSTLAPTAAVTSTLAITPPSAPLDQCQYTIRSGDFMANLVQQLQVTYSDARCATGQPLPCAYDAANPGAINIGWVLIFSNTSPEACQTLGGGPPQAFPTRTPAPATPFPTLPSPTDTP